MRISDSGVELIAEFEGWRARPYNDPAPGGGHCTIGFGHLIHRGPCTARDHSTWGTLSRARGLELLRSDAQQAEAAVEFAVTVRLNQNEFDALVSFTFNVGANAMTNSTLVSRLNAGNRQAAADEFMRWVKAGGVTLPGLVRRRKAERALFLKPSETQVQKERRWMAEYDELKESGRDLDRRRVLWHAMAKARKTIWRLAQPVHAGGDGRGWSHMRRRERYRELLKRR